MDTLALDDVEKHYTMMGSDARIMCLQPQHGTLTKKPVQNTRQNCTDTHQESVPQSQWHRIYPKCCLDMPKVIHTFLLIILADCCYRMWPKCCLDMPKETITDALLI